MMIARVMPLALSVSRFWQERCGQRLLFLLAVLALSAIQLRASSVNSTANSTTAPDSDQLSSDAKNVSLTLIDSVGLLGESMNMSVDPCEDFYQYSCGSFSKTNKPQDASSVWKKMMHRLKGLLEKPYNKSSDPKYFQNTKKFYQSCVGEDRLRKLGTKPLLDLVDKLGPWPMMSNGSWNGSQDLETTLVNLAYVDVLPLYTIGVDSDPENNSQPVITLSPGVQSIPSQYLVEERNSTVLTTYEQFYRALAVSVLGLAPSRTLNQSLSDVLDFESKVAEIYQGADSAEPEKVFLDEMPTLFPKFNGTKYLTTFFKRANVTISNDSVISVLFDYVQNLTNLVEQTDQRVMFNYLLIRLVRTYYTYLAQEFRDLELPMLRVLYGVNYTQARWKTCVYLTKDVMEKAVGSLYVSKYFSPAQKKEATSVVEFIRESMKEVINSSQWIDNSTKIKALEKADGIEANVGYPGYFLNKTIMEEQHQNMVFDRKAFFQNILAMTSRKVSDIAKSLHEPPPPKEEWSVPPTDVNAYYDQHTNVMTFPAAILQPPFFGGHLIDAQVFGSLGMVAGHELCHAFDDTGRFFNKKGNLAPWWSNATAQIYEDLASCFVDQYSKHVVSGVRLDGSKTLNENIADNGGIKVSHKAFKKWQSIHGEQPLVPGLSLTNDQIFFISMAQLWCRVETNEEAKINVMTSSHSPEIIRTNLVVSNSKEFAKAFNCPAGSKMNPKAKCEVW